MLGLLNTVLSRGGSLLTYVKDGLVMANRFLTPPKLTHPAQGSAEFNGSSDYIQVKDDGKGSAFDTQTFTISAWIQIDALGDNVIWSYDFTSHAVPYYAQQMRVVTAGNIYFAWNNGSVLQDIQGGTITPNKWHHVAVTFGNNSQKIYIDGSQVQSGSSTATITYYNQEVWIGKANFGGEFEGNMANVAFWNRALSSDEINSVMWKSYEGLTSTESNGLQAWYSLDDITSPAASLANMQQLATDKNATIENTAAITAAINSLS